MEHFPAICTRFFLKLAFWSWRKCMSRHYVSPDWSPQPVRRGPRTLDAIGSRALQNVSQLFGKRHQPAHSGTQCSSEWSRWASVLDGSAPRVSKVTGTKSKSLLCLQRERVGVNCASFPLLYAGILKRERCIRLKVVFSDEVKKLKAFLVSPHWTVSNNTYFLMYWGVVCVHISRSGLDFFFFFVVAKRRLIFLWTFFSFSKDFIK